MEKSKQTYKLPKGWIWSTIGEIGIVQSGGTPSTRNKEFWGDEISWITPADLSGYKKKYISKGNRNITKLGLDYSSAKLLPKGTILFSSRAPIGYTVIAKNELATNQGFKNLIPTKSLNSEFVYYFFKTLKSKAEDVASGTTFLELSATKFSQLRLPLPPLKEQQRIVSKIESLFSELDQAEKGLQKAKKQLEVYRQALLKSAFEGKLTKQWRQENNIELAVELLERIRNERQSKYQHELGSWKEAVKRWEKNGKEGAKPKMPKRAQSVSLLSPKEIEKLPLLPTEWKWVKFGEVCLKIMDGTHFSPKNVKKGSYKYITAKNILEGRIDLADISYVSEEDHKIIYKRCDVAEGDVLFVKDGSKTGRAAVNNLKEEFSLLSSVGVFRTFQDKIRPKFLEYYLNAEITRKRMLSQVAGVAITRLTLTKLNNSLFSLCSTMEQDQIVGLLESQFTLIENLEKSILKSLNGVILFRHSILKKAFDGKLVNQNTNDESANLLLQTIKKEKEDYLKAQKALEKLKPKKKRQMEGKKTALEILIESKEPISTEELWTNSIHEGDIESFYSEIKDIYSKLTEVKESTESLLSLKK